MRPLPRADRDGGPERPAHAGRQRAARPAASWPGCRSTRGCRGPGSATTSRSAGSSPPGWAGRSSTGWSSRCSAVSTPGAPTSCRWRRRCRSWRRTRAGSARCSPPPGRAGRPRTSAGQDGAVFGAPRGGVGRLPAAVARLSGGRDPHRRRRSASCARTPTGWRLTVGPTRSPEEVLADAVVLAVPAAPAARLLRADVAGGRVRPGRSVALRVDGRGRAGLPGRGVPVAADRLGVPGAAGGRPRSVKAVDVLLARSGAGTPTRRPAWCVVRASVGRLGEEAVLQRDDAELVELVLGRPHRRPRASPTRRWTPG